MDPGTYISIAELAFKGATYAIKSFRNGLNFATDTERLVLNLEMERFRLQVWGENAGLAPANGEAARFPDRLVPLFQVIASQLEGIRDLVQDTDKLAALYGLVPTTNPPANPDHVRKIVERMQRSIRSCGRTLDPNTDYTEAHDTATDVVEKRRPNPWERTRWAIRDLKKFESLVHNLSCRISTLHQLLSESQQRKTHEDNGRVNIVVVGSAVDQCSLDLIRAAVQGERDTSTIRSAVERRALADDLPGAKVLEVGPAGRLALSDFKIAEDLLTKPRFLAAKAASPTEIFLFERKSFDPNISPQDKIKLTQRVQRLMLLLKRPKSSEFSTPYAEGCIHDPSHFCWWIVLRFPVMLATTSPTPDILSRPEPVSLLTLLKSKIRPPLEQRYRLAKILTATLSELYNSSWLHKGIRSENILFNIPSVPSSSTAIEEISKITDSLVLCGFDYSRQETESSTIDRARSSGEVLTAIYRHPKYQGDAAEGYKIQYDIYSLGLVLLEIALWQPLATFLKSDKPGSSGSSNGAGSSSVKLSPDMQVFHASHASILKKRVVAVADAELGFRVGTSYSAAVQFCLGFADRPALADTDEIPAHPVLEFYDNVVVPLSRLARSD